MRPRMLVAFGIALTVAGLGSAAAQAQESYHHGRLRYVDPGVTIQRATDDGAAEAAVNDPFLPGDRVWTDAGGRVDVQFGDGSAVRLDRRSKLDYAGHEEDREEQVTLRLWSGSLIIRVRPRTDTGYAVETPGGAVLPADGSAVRIDVDAGEARISVYQGEAALDDGRDRVRLSAGERTFARWGSPAEQPQGFDTEEMDDFAQWEADRQAEERWAQDSARYLPGELANYSDEFDRNGSWRYEPAAGYVWIPQVEVGWRPYWNGHWAWTPYGWTWVPYEHWGWAPFHYGRWDYSASLGWYWLPGQTWSPAWVGWAVGGGYVGWCPLGLHDRPVMVWAGHAAPRDRFGRNLDAWMVVRQGQLGSRDVARLRVPVDRLDAAAVRAADTAQLRPTRDGSHLLQADAVPRAIRTRPMPGDFVRELAVDNKTTIPAPWFRHGGGTQPPTVEVIGRGGEPAPPPGGGGGSGESRGPTSQQVNGAAPRSNGETSSSGASHTRPVPWFRPPEQGVQGGGQGNEHGQANGAASGGGVSNAGSDHSAARPRDDGAGHSSGGGVYRPHDNPGGGETRPAGGAHSGGDAKPSSGGQSPGGSKGGSSSSSGSGSRSAERATPRPHSR